MSEPKPDPCRSDSPESKPHRRTYDEARARELLSGIDVSVETSAVVLSGRCPRCHHELDDFVLVNRYRGERRLLRGKLEKADGEPVGDIAKLDFVLSCNCESDHSGRPDGQLGCGFFMGLRLQLPCERADGEAREDTQRLLDWFRPPKVEPHADERPDPSTAGRFHAIPHRATLRERLWAERARKVEEDQLSTIRGQAEKWGGTVAALLSLFGLGLLFQGTDDFRELAPPGPVLAWLFTVVAVIFALIATYMAASAAQGRRSWLPIVTGRGLRALDLAFTRDADERLKVSGRAVVVAIGSIGVTLAILWLAPRQGGGDAGGSTAVVVQRSGATLCGELAGQPTGDVLLKPPNGEQALTLRDVASVMAVEAC